MSQPSLLDQAFHVIMKRMVETGQSPFYTELASELGVAVEEGRKALHDLFRSGIPGWLYPRTDHIVSFLEKAGKVETTGHVTEWTDSSPDAAPPVCHSAGTSRAFHRFGVLDRRERSCI
ncbi:MAG: hypothetical protein AB1512_16485 [Thermodesulfobacteriota bacterium]